MNILRKMQEAASLRAKLAALEAEITADARAYSDRNGYLIRLRPDQVARELERA